MIVYYTATSIDGGAGRESLSGLNGDREFERSKQQTMHLRVNVEGLGYVGLIEVLSPAVTLTQLRVLLSQTFDVDALPRNYMFLAPSGSAIGVRAEPVTLAFSLRPSITLLSTSESPLVGALVAPARPRAARRPFTPPAGGGAAPPPHAWSNAREHRETRKAEAGVMRSDD